MMHNSHPLAYDANLGVGVAIANSRVVAVKTLVSILTTVFPAED
jgi:hypothetical protein